MSLCKNRDMVAKQSMKPAMTLADSAIDAILQAPNCCEAMSVLWSMEDYVPAMIRNKMKTACTSYDKLLYSFNRHILENIWGCPQKYIDKYADDTNIDEILDNIIYGDPINILDVPEPIIHLLNSRDLEICDTREYNTHFSRNMSYFDDDIGWDWENHCSEERIRIVEGDDREQTWIYPAFPDPHRPVYRCGCGSEYFEDECYCYADENCTCDSWYTGLQCRCGAEEYHEYAPSDFSPR